MDADEVRTDDNYNVCPIRKPFVQLFEFTRYLLFYDSNLVHRLVEIPQLQTDIIFALREFQLVRNGNNFGPILVVYKRYELQACARGKDWPQLLADEGSLFQLRPPDRLRLPLWLLRRLVGASSDRCQPVALCL